MSVAYACVAGDALKHMKHSLPFVREFVEERNLK